MVRYAVERLRMAERFQEVGAECKKRFQVAELESSNTGMYDMTRTRTGTVADLSGACFTIWRTGATIAYAETILDDTAVYCYDGTLYQI